MIFYSKNENQIVWDKNTKKRLALFKDHRFETEDAIIIEKLKPHFKHEELPLGEMSYQELIRVATEKGMKAFGKKKEELLKMLEGEQKDE